MNADLSDPVKFHALSFSNISGTIKFEKIARITWDRNAPSFATASDDVQRKEIRLDSLQEGKTFQISLEIVSIVNFWILWDHSVKSSFRQ